MQVLSYPVILLPDSSGGYFVTCPVFQGCYSQGETVGEALKNIKEAIDLCIEELEEEGSVLPNPNEIIVQQVTIQHES